MKFDDLKKLHQKKYRQEFKRYLVEGEHLILELQKASLQQPSLLTTELYVTEKYADWNGPFNTTVISSKRMAQISDTKTPQGIIACVPMPAMRTIEQLDRSKTLFLYEPQDPGNLGTILRTLAWFGGFNLILSPNSVDPYNPKVVRSSMGAIFHVPMLLDIEVETLSQHFKDIAYLDIQGEQIQQDGFKNFDCYVFGNEARGVPRDTLTSLKGKAYTIQGSGQIESLNLASAVNICAYQLAI